MTILSTLNGLFGLCILVGIAYLFSNNRKGINWRLVLSGFGLQIVFAILVLRGTELSVYFAHLAGPNCFSSGSA